MRRCSHCGHYGDPKTHCRPGNGRNGGKHHHRSLHKHTEGCGLPPRIPHASLFLYEWEEYRYYYFNDEKSIRLLELLPGEPEDAIQCNLHIQPIRRTRPYQAISYTWGSPDDRGDILCEGKLLNVPRNLMHALQRFRKRKRARILWADAVCIDQDDDQEKAHQVQMMGQVFERAQTVLVWLGKDHGIDVNTVFESVRRIAMSRLVDQEVIVQRIFRKLTDYFWQHFRKVTRLPWFKRLWILQEIGLATHATMHCGSKVLCWTHFVAFCDFLKEEQQGRLDYELLAYVWDIARVARLDFKNKNRDSSVTFSVLRLGAPQECSDPRDRIYGFLGHPAFRNTFANPKSEYCLPVDYTIPHKELYLKVARMMVGIFSQDPLYMLLYVMHDLSSFGDLDCPSWVPRWDIDQFPVLLTSGYGHSRFFKAGGASQKVSFDGLALSPRGFRFDKITWTSDTFRRNSIPNNPSQAFLNHNPHPLSQIWGYFGDNISKSVVEAIVISLCSPQVTFLSFESPDIELHQRLISSFLMYAFEMGMDLSGFNLSELNENRGLFAANYACFNRCFFVTERGWVGVGPEVSSVGDEVCIFFGGQTPFVVHQLPSASESIYRLCGSCYVHGIMQGEAVNMWRDGYFESQTFNLV